MAKAINSSATMTSTITIAKKDTVDEMDHCNTEKQTRILKDYNNTSLGHWSIMKPLLGITNTAIVLLILIQ